MVEEEHWNVCWVSQSPGVHSWCCCVLFWVWQADSTLTVELTSQQGPAWGRGTRGGQVLINNNNHDSMGSMRHTSSSECLTDPYLAEGNLFLSLRSGMLSIQLGATEEAGGCHGNLPTYVVTAPPFRRGSRGRKRKLKPLAVNLWPSTQTTAYLSAAGDISPAHPSEERSPCLCLCVPQ